MRKIIFILPVILVLQFSCNTTDDNLDVDLPDWLRERIEHDEAYVLQNPQSMLAYGVWVRTEYQNTHYFEYSNPLSSSLSSPISFSQKPLEILIIDEATDYYRNKCCSKVIWYGSRIDGEYLDLFHKGE
jgi:hypothetical protein